MFRMRPQNKLSSDNPIHQKNKASVLHYFIFIFLLIAGTQTGLQTSTAAVTNLIQVEDVCKNGPGTGSCFPVNVSVINKVLKVNNQDFMVKGVTYSAKPVATFLHYGSDFNGACQYTGQYDFGYPPYYLPHPEVRFERSSPDAQFACPYDPDVYQRDANILFRDMTTVSEMNANTIRTYGKVTHELLDYAYAKGLKVIAGYWIDHSIDYSFPNIPGAPIENGALRRQTYIDDFVFYVKQFRSHPAVLMWGVSNENNLDFCNGCYIKGECNGGVQASGFYNFVNDMAKALKAIEPTTGKAVDPNHPVIVTLADLNSGVQLYAPAMTDVGVIGVNAYRGYNFNGYPAGQPNLFEKFKSIFPNKTMIVTEFGADAWNTNGYDHDPKLGFEDQKAQKAFVVSQWNEIANNLTIFGGVVNGGIVHHLTDFWDGYGQRQMKDDPTDKCAWISSEFTSSVASHDHEFSNPEVFGKGIMPDDRVNPEWWGLLSLQKSQNGVCNSTSGIDCLLSREAYHALYSKFTNPLAKTDPTFNFSLSTHPLSGGTGPTVVTQGSNGGRIINVWTGTPAVSKPVVIVLQNLPSGVHLNEPIAECPGINCSRTISLKVDSNAVAGNYPIKVLALANGYTATAEFQLSITQGAKRKNAVYDFDYLNLNPATNLFFASDSKGNYQPGQLNNMDSNDQVGGVKGKALNFDGVNNYVKIPNFTWDNGPVTITFWSKVNASDVNSQKTTFAFGATNSWSERFSAHVPYVDGFLYWDYGDSNGLGRVKVKYSDHYDVWALVVLSSAGEGGNVRSATIMSYKNGAHRTTSTSQECSGGTGATGCSDGPTHPFTEFQIGHSPENQVGTGYHKGLIDDFRIYDHVLTNTEIQALYQEVYPRCGDQVCQSAETPLSCPVDCRTLSCGNGVCGLDEYGRLEKYTTCPLDCPSSCGPQDRICDIRDPNCTSPQQRCDLNETNRNCALDCPSTKCGDGRGICEANGVDLFGNVSPETYSTCPVDCPLTTCGNSICDSGENGTNCQTDCPLGQNLVVNGGFENKDASWTNLSTSISASKHVSTEQFYEGTHSAKFKVATLERYIYQRVQNLTPGKYRFSAMLYTGGLISGKTKMRVEWRKNGVASPLQTETIDLLSGANAFWVGWYKDIEMPTIPGKVINEVRIYLITEGGSGSVYFDDVKMQKFN